MEGDERGHEQALHNACFEREERQPRDGGGVQRNTCSSRSISSDMMNSYRQIEKHAKESMY